MRQVGLPLHTGGIHLGACALKWPFEYTGAVSGAKPWFAGPGRFTLRV